MLVTFETVVDVKGWSDVTLVRVNTSETPDGALHVGRPLQVKTSLSAGVSKPLSSWISSL